MTFVHPTRLATFPVVTEGEYVDGFGEKVARHHVYNHSWPFGWYRKPPQ